MKALDQFTEDQRQVITAEIEKHKQEAYAVGLEDGRAQAGAVVVANWIRSAAKSWTMRGAAFAVAAGLAGDIWPVVAELLAGRVDPQWLALGGAAVMALRARSIGK